MKKAIIITWLEYNAKTSKAIQNQIFSVLIVIMYNFD